MTISTSTSLQIAAIFEISLLSFIGIALPFSILYQNFLRRKQQNAQNFAMEIKGDTFSTLKSVSAGVMLGVAMVPN